MLQHQFRLFRSRSGAERERYRRFWEDQRRIFHEYAVGQALERGQCDNGVITFGEYFRQSGVLNGRECGIDGSSFYVGEFAVREARRGSAEDGSFHLEEAKKQDGQDRKDGFSFISEFEFFFASLRLCGNLS